MGTEQCAVVVPLVVSLVVSLLNLKLWFKVGLRINIDGVISFGHGIAPVEQRDQRERQRMLAN